MKRAVIDLGTNTFNLLVGSIEGKQIVLYYTTKEAVMLGMGGINEGFIAEDAMLRAQHTLSNFKEKCSELSVENILGIGTAAMREATNAQELIDWARKTLQLEIRVVSGEDEADLIYKGVSLVHPFEEPGMIMDIGGGSNEFIFANSDCILEAKSFNIGVSRIYQQLGQPEEFTPEIQSKVSDFFEQETKGFFENRNIAQLIGASGSFETLYEMLHEIRFPINQKMQELPIEDVRRLIHWSINSTLEDRMNNPWIVPIRKKMLPIAAFSILWVINKLKTERITICPYSLKEGAFKLNN